jgi:hypothetical protein
MPQGADLSISDFENYFRPQLEIFFKKGIDYIYKALLTLQKEAK